MFRTLIYWPLLRAWLICLNESFTPTQRKAIRQVCEFERAEEYVIHKLKTQWFFSGVIRNNQGTRDLGVLPSAEIMNRKQALKWLHENFADVTILHIDDRNKIITYARKE